MTSPNAPPSCPASGIQGGLDRPGPGVRLMRRTRDPGANSEDTAHFRIACSRMIQPYQRSALRSRFACARLSGTSVFFSSSSRSRYVPLWPGMTSTTWLMFTM